MHERNRQAGLAPDMARAARLAIQARTAFREPSATWMHPMATFRNLDAVIDAPDGFVALLRNRLALPEQHCAVRPAADAAMATCLWSASTAEVGGCARLQDVSLLSLKPANLQQLDRAREP